MAAAAPDIPPYQAGWTCLCGNHANVTVEPRTWAGINRQGGVGTIVKYHLADDTFDIKLILRGRDNRVARNYLSCYDLTAMPGTRKRPKREFYDPRVVCVKRAKTGEDATACDECQEPDEPSVPPAGGPHRRHASLPSAPRVVPPPPPAVSIAPCHGHPQQEPADDDEADRGTGRPTRPRARQFRRSQISTNVADHSSTAASSMTSPIPDQRSGSRRVATRPSTAWRRGGAAGVESVDVLGGTGVGSSDQGSLRTTRSRTTDSSTTSAMNSITAPSTTASTSAASGVTAGGCSTTSSSAHHSRSEPPIRTTGGATTSHHITAADSRTVDALDTTATAVSSDTLGPVGGSGNLSSRTGRAAPSESSSFVADVAAFVIGPSNDHRPGTSKSISGMVGTVVASSQGGNTTSTTNTGIAPNGHGDVMSMSRAAGTTVTCATAGQSSSNSDDAAAVVARTSKTHASTSGPGTVKPGNSTSVRSVVPSGLGGNTPTTSCSTTNSSCRRSSGNSTNSHGPAEGHGNGKHPIGAASGTTSPATPGQSSRVTADVAAAVIEQSSNEVVVSGPGRTEPMRSTHPDHTTKSTAANSRTALSGVGKARIRNITRSERRAGDTSTSQGSTISRPTTSAAAEPISGVGMSQTKRSGVHRGDVSNTRNSHRSATATLAAAASTNPATAEARATGRTGGSKSTTPTSRAVPSRANTASSSSTSHCSGIRTTGPAVSGGSTGTNTVRMPAGLVPAGAPAPVVRTQSGAPALLRDRTHTNAHPTPPPTVAKPIGRENLCAGQSLNGVDKPQKTAALPSSRAAQGPRKPVPLPGPNTTEMNGISSDDDNGRLLELSPLHLPSPPPRRSRSSASSIVIDDGPGRFYEFTSMLSELMGEDKVKETHLRQVASSRGFAEREVTGFLRTADEAGRVLIAGGYIYHC